MTFAEEIKNYTVDDLQLIIATQKDLYSEEEMAQMEALLNDKLGIKQKESEGRLPETIICEKCDGPNPFSNEVCCFCNHNLEKLKQKYYNGEYYEIDMNQGYYNSEYVDYSEDEECEDKDYLETSDENKESYAFHYVISFLIPLVGFIVGAVMLASDDVDKRWCGKTCIIIGILSMLGIGLALGLLL